MQLEVCGGMIACEFWIRLKFKLKWTLLVNRGDIKNYHKVSCLGEHLLKCLNH